MQKHAIFLSGPIGVGKTTLGRALGERLAGGFIDGDDHSNPDGPWYCSILQTSKAIVRTGLQILDEKTSVVIAYPLNCINWIYFRRKFGDAGYSAIFVTLRASFASITHESRGRRFSEDERQRIEVMIAQGYDARPFSDLFFDTAGEDFTFNLTRLETEIRKLLAN